MGLDMNEGEEKKGSIFLRENSSYRYVVLRLLRDEREGLTPEVSPRVIGGLPLPASRSRLFVGAEWPTLGLSSFLRFGSLLRYEVPRFCLML